MDNIPASVPSTPFERPAPARTPDPDHAFIKLYCCHCGEKLPVKLSCGDRTCPECRLKWFGYHFKTLLDVVTAWPSVYFLTLTIKNIPDSAWGRYHVDLIRKNFSRFRSRFKQIAGGFYVVQATNRGAGWHLHLHILYDGRYIPKDDISKAWAEITAGSFIVDIMRVDNPRVAVRYLLSDFLQSPRIRPEDQEAFNGVFRGSRIVQPFGKYRKTRFKVGPYKCPKCGESCWAFIEDILGEKRRFHRCYEDDS